MSSDQDLQKFAGTSRHFVHFDEEPPEPVYEECRARLVDTNGDIGLSHPDGIDVFTVDGDSLLLTAGDESETFARIDYDP